MFTFTSKVPELDKENASLLKASTILEKMGNGPGLTADQFYKELALSELDTEDFQAITLAAISIEAMMNLDVAPVTNPYADPTIH